MITALPTWKATLVKDRIAVSVPDFSFETAGWFHSFPWPRQVRGGWTMAATPYTAVRLIEAGVIVDEGIVRLAGQWHDESEFDTSEQPGITKLPPWEHQRLAYWFAIGRCAAGLGICMGGGKTKVAADLAANWMVERMLILSPLPVVPVWRKELGKHYPLDFECIELEGPAAKKLAAARRIETAPRRRLTAVVCGFEAAWRDPLGAYLLSIPWDLVALDESHKIKDPNGKASNFCAQLGRKARRRLCLTGTPMPHSPLDIFAQMRFLEPAILGTSVSAFKQQYAIESKFVPGKIDRWINQDELTEKVAQVWIRITREDAKLDLPPVQHIDVPVTISAKARSYYQKLERELVAEIVDSEQRAGVVKIDNPLVKVLRLQQVACGFVGAEVEGDQIGPDKVLLELDTAKTDTLEELLDDMGAEPKVVFCRFHHDLEQVERLCAKLGQRYGELSQRKGAPDGMTGQATMSEEVDVLGVQIRSGGAGIDLTRSAIGIFYSIGCISQGDFEQACARLDRPGQTRPVRLYHLLATKTVDERAYEAIHSGREIVEVVLAALRRGGSLVST